MLKQWIALKAWSDWLTKTPNILCHSSKKQLAPENVVIVAGINELNQIFLLCYHTFLVYIKTNIEVSVSG